MSTLLFVVSLVVAGIALWIHGYRVARRSPPRLARRPGDFTDVDLWRALR